MTDPDRKAFEDLVKAALVLFVMLDMPNHLAVQTHTDNPEIGWNETVELTITRHVNLPLHPIPATETFAGVTGYAEGVTA